MLFVHVEMDEYNICVDCYKNAGFYLLFISYFLWIFWTNQTWKNEYSKTISAAAKHWKSFFALFSMVQLNTLKVLTRKYFPLNPFYTQKFIQPKSHTIKWFLTELFSNINIIFPAQNNNGTSLIKLGPLYCTRHRLERCTRPTWLWPIVFTLFSLSSLSCAFPFPV